MSSNTAQIEQFFSTYHEKPSTEIYHVGDEFGVWRITAFLEKGGSGEVYCVENRRTKEKAALKVFVPRHDESESRRAVSRGHFLKEINLLRQNPYPFFPKLLDEGEKAGAPFLVAELLQPIDLPKKDREVAAFMLELSRAVQTLHIHGLVHRDIKPQNILRRSNGNLVLIDFGLVKETGGLQSPLDSPVTIVDGKVRCAGTPGYAAPEQMNGGAISPAADIHALGMIINKCFEGHIPDAWDPIVNRATSTIPGQRYPEVSALIRAIRWRHHRRWTRLGLIVAFPLFLFLMTLFFQKIRFAPSLEQIPNDQLPQGSLRPLTPKSVSIEEVSVVTPKPVKPPDPAQAEKSSVVQPQPVARPKPAAFEKKTMGETPVAPAVTQSPSPPREPEIEEVSVPPQAVPFESLSEQGISKPWVFDFRAETNLTYHTVRQVPYHRIVDWDDLPDIQIMPQKLRDGVEKALPGTLIYLNNQTYVLPNPLILKPDREYWVIGPGLVDGVLESAGGGKINLYRCLFINRTRNTLAEKGITYSLWGNVYLNFTSTEIEKEERYHFLKTKGTSQNDIRSHGPETLKALREEDRNQIHEIDAVY